jgi:hypothetical protein
MAIISWAFLLRALTPVKWHDIAANVLPFATHAIANYVLSKILKARSASPTAAS